MPLSLVRGALVLLTFTSYLQFGSSHPIEENVRIRLAFDITPGQSESVQETTGPGTHVWPSGSARVPK